MPRKQKRDQDGIHARKRSPFWWATLPGVGGGSTRRSTGIRRDQDPEGLRARAWRVTEIAKGPQVIQHEGPTFDDLLLNYLGSVTPTKRAPKRDHASARALFPVFTGRTLASIQGADVRGYIAIRTAADVGPACINRELALMSAASNWARLHLDWTIANPWQGRRLQEPTGRVRHLDHAEAAALLAAADRRAARWPWLADFCRLCLSTGLRPGEALGLTWARVDLGRRLIQFGTTDQKSGKAVAIPINNGARAALIERARFRATWCPGSEWVFCRRDGSRVGDVKKGFIACAAEAGIPDLHPHDLRRTFGSWLVQAGVGIERVSRLLRHADVAITARVYAHLRPSDLADAAAILDQIGNEVSHSGFTPAATATTGKKKPLVSG